ncbi:MAG: tRNA (N6-threonylcarbamoyladenosine(37)-N6)-methyltransferase TrmO [Proteobacteria bacterium]|nr:tRNA (N6-threonylcarbamoyladenosine(37)-N6)-methyltransferase TrmO [Pseudomonadota bacterium]
MKKAVFKPIGHVMSPYKEKAPHHGRESDKGDFRLVLDPEYAGGLDQLKQFKYIYVIAYLHKSGKKYPLRVSPPWAKGKEVGVFASRSPQRPNPIGLTITRVKKIRGNEIFTTGLDLLDGTPLLDIKPYIKDADVKSKANNGWIKRNLNSPWAKPKKESSKQPPAPLPARRLTGLRGE